MCGIVALYRTDGAAVAADVLQRMTDTVRHRGPDDSGCAMHGHVGLGHRRLSIIDLAGGHQPMISADGRLQLVFNGEIYNFRELRRELEGKGERFRTNSDTEVVVALHQRYGDAAVERLRGMFAYALYDGQRDELLLVRDRLGIKPLYFVEGAGFVAAGSEIKALLVLDEVSRDPDADALHEYFSRRYIGTPRTLFRQVQKLPPGYMLRVRRDGVTRQRFWQLGFRPDPVLTPALALERLEAALLDAVESHLVSDVPVGVFLSGGLDSSMVVAAMRRVTPGAIRTYTAVFPGHPDVDEGGFARAVARAFGTEHCELPVEPAACEVLERVAWHLDEPCGDPAVLPTYLLAELTRRHVKVVLTGEGSDEFNGGYAKYRRAYLAHVYRGMPGALRHPIRVAASAGLLGPRVRRFVRDTEAGNGGSAFSNPFLDTLLLRDALPLPNPRPWYGDEPTEGELNRLFHEDARSWMLDDLLLKVDKMTMAHGLEARVPYLDHRYVELAATVPSRWKVTIRQTKALLRRLAGRYLPGPIRRRGQHGFNMPLPAWFRGDFHDYVRSVVNERSIRQRGVLHWPTVAAILRQAESDAGWSSIYVWQLVMLELWYRQFVDQVSLSPPA